MWRGPHRLANAADASLLVFEAQDVLERIGTHGDLFADVLTLVQAPT